MCHFCRIHSWECCFVLVQQPHSQAWAELLTVIPAQWRKFHHETIYVLLFSVWNFCFAGSFCCFSRQSFTTTIPPSFFFTAPSFSSQTTTHKVNENPTLWRATCRVQWPSGETVQPGDKSGREASLTSYSRQYKLQLRRRSRCLWWGVSSNCKHLVLVSGCGF